MTTNAERIRYLRERRGWTQLEVARHLDRLAWTQSGRHVGVNADMVAKWERGVKAPSRRYQALLDCLFDDDRGSPTEVSAPDPHADGPQVDPIDMLVARTGRSASRQDAREGRPMPHVGMPAKQRVSRP